VSDERRPYVATRYRRAYRVWVGEVYRVSDWVGRNLDGVMPRCVWRGYALTERGIRRRLARAAWREKHPPLWTVGGRHA